MTMIQFPKPPFDKYGGEFWFDPEKVEYIQRSGEMPTVYIGVASGVQAFDFDSPAEADAAFAELKRAMGVPV